MAELPLTREQHRRLVHLIAQRAGILTPLQRQNLLEMAGLNEFITRLNFATDAQTFAQQLVRELQNRGTLAQTGQPALVSLLEELSHIVRGQEEEAAFVAELLAQAPPRIDSPGYTQPNPALATPPAHSPTSPATTLTQMPSSAAIRTLLGAAFNDQELSDLCFDYFQPVYQNFTGGMSKAQKIQLLLDYCSRHDQIVKLLAVVREANPAQYKRHIG